MVNFATLSTAVWQYERPTVVKATVGSTHDTWGLPPMHVTTNCQGGLFDRMVLFYVEFCSTIRH